MSEGQDDREPREDKCTVTVDFDNDKKEFKAVGVAMGMSHSNGEVSSSIGGLISPHDMFNMARAMCMEVQSHIHEVPGMEEFDLLTELIKERDGDKQKSMGT